MAASRWNFNMAMKYIGRKKMRINGSYTNVSYEISSLAFNYLLYGRHLAASSPAILSDIVIPQLLETGDPNLIVKVEDVEEGKYALIAYIQRDTNLEKRLSSRFNN